MKHLPNISKTLKNYFSVLMFFFYQSMLWAQEKKEVDVNLNVEDGSETVWYGQPWMWIVGAAVFILLIVAITRGGGKKD